jgi:hypothetical protein
MVVERETWFSSYDIYFKWLNLADVMLRRLLSHNQHHLKHCQNVRGSAFRGEFRFSKCTAAFFLLKNLAVFKLGNNDGVRALPETQKQSLLRPCKKNPQGYWPQG